MNASERNLKQVKVPQKGHKLALSQDLIFIKVKESRFRDSIFYKE